LSQNIINDYTEYVYNDDTWQTEANYIGNSTIAYSPSVIAGVYADFHTHGFKGIWRTQYVGKQYITNGMNENLALDPYCVSSIDLSYTLKLDDKKNIRFGVLLNNIFNSMYCSNAFAYSAIYGGERYDEAYYFPQAGFNALANVRFNF
jgi:iron complex outermembrane receptor protein